MPTDAFSQVLIYSFFFSMPSRQTLRFSGGNREDKENRGSTSMVTMIQEDSDDDGPILYRDDDDDEMEDEGKHKFFLLFPFPTRVYLKLE